jgi:hypothetical protein
MEFKSWRIDECCQGPMGWVCLRLEMPEFLAGSDYNMPTIRIEPSPDTAPPARVTDLQATNVQATSLDLTWTAPGDDGIEGTADSYSLSYATFPITEENWLSASITTCPLPSPPGTREHVPFSGLEPETTYWMALKARDEVGNWSVLSNVVPATTIAQGRAYAYVADGPSGLQVIDVSNPSNPSIVGSADTPDSARRYCRWELCDVADGFTAVSRSSMFQPERSLPLWGDRHRPERPMMRAAGPSHLLVTSSLRDQRPDQAAPSAVGTVYEPGGSLRPRPGLRVH